MSNPSKEKLLWLFDYDQDRGVLIWKNHWSKTKATIYKGKIAGKDHDGYRRLRIARKNYLVHHLIWFIETGKWPERIDHKDGLKSNNRFSNLKICTQRQNMQNMSRHRNGKLVGAHFHKSTGVWRSHIEKEGKQISLGNFQTEFAAHWRYLQELRNVDA
jgi:hypothetical protein